MQCRRRRRTDSKQNVDELVDERDEAKVVSRKRVEYAKEQASGTQIEGPCGIPAPPSAPVLNADIQEGSPRLAAMSACHCLPGARLGRGHIEWQPRSWLGLEAAFVCSFAPVASRLCRRWLTGRRRITHSSSEVATPCEIPSYALRS
jgi:hypothetical protein